MEHYCLIQALVSHIEAAVRSDSALASSAQAMAMSYSHLRDVFKTQTGVSIGRHERERRLAQAAFDLSHGACCTIVSWLHPWSRRCKP